MAKFAETDAGLAFISSAESRETDPQIMRAIAFFALNENEAEMLYNGDGLGVICHAINLWEHITKNGLFDATEFCWGAAGNRWWDAISSRG